MALTAKKMSLIIGTLGALAFVFGLTAEIYKPASGTPIIGKDVVICKYRGDPTLALGYLSIGFLAAAFLAGIFSVFYPYRGMSLPLHVLFQTTHSVVFFVIALCITGLAAGMLLWPTITEHYHIVRNVHHNLQTTCPTAKTGLLGGGAMLSLCAAFFWLVSLMIANNETEDYFDHVKKRVKVDPDDVIRSIAGLF